jgi:hypothetical protein
MALTRQLPDYAGKHPPPAGLLNRPRALERWQEEIRLGLRSNDGRCWDELAAAASWEQAGLEAETIGQFDAAASCYQSARGRLPADFSAGAISASQQDARPSAVSRQPNLRAGWPTASRSGRWA